MKKILLLIFLLVTSFGLSQNKTQSVDTSSAEEALQISIIEEIPLFKECETIEKEQRMTCFNEMMHNHIKKNFTYPILAAKFRVQGTVAITFTIDQEGKITDIKSKGHQLLTDEAERIIKSLPQLKPGRQRGKTVKVKYGLPITFKLQ